MLAIAWRTISGCLQSCVLLDSNRSIFAVSHVSLDKVGFLAVRFSSLSILIMISVSILRSLAAASDEIMPIYSHKSLAGSLCVCRASLPINLD